MSAYKVFFGSDTTQHGSIGHFAEASDIISASMIADAGQNTFPYLHNIWIECDGELVEKRALVQLSPGSEKLWIRQRGEESIIMEQKAL